ncbi:MAG: hypothetical protein AAGA48_02655 [Myxococcota bacterium]
MQLLDPVLVVPTLLFLSALGYFLFRGERLRRFTRRHAWRVVGFGEVIWGRPSLDGPVNPVSAVMLVALGLGLWMFNYLVVGFGVVYVGDFSGGRPWFGPAFAGALALSVVFAVGISAWVAALRLLLHPLVERLRFTQQHVVMDWVREGFAVGDAQLTEAPPLRTPQRIAWADVTDVRYDTAAKRLVVRHEGRESSYGPVDADTGVDMLMEARRRLAVPEAMEPTGARERLAEVQRKAKQSV